MQFRNQYDNDTTTWSPQGRIFQVEYALEAVKQGAICLGVVSSSHVVLAALQRSAGKLAQNQEKLYALDQHLGIAISGLTSDARALSQLIFNEALTSRNDMDRPIPLRRLITTLSTRAQQNTQHYGGRPFGVGLLLAGIDETGPHLFELQPSGAFFEYSAYSIGARSQAARTYFENHLDEFPSTDPDQLIIHALRALSDCLPPSQSLEASNTAVAIVGKDQAFRLLATEEIAPLLATIIPRAQAGSIPAVSTSAEPQDTIED